MTKKKIIIIITISNYFSILIGSQTINQRTIGHVNAHLISWPCKAQNIQNLENIW